MSVDYFNCCVCGRITNDCCMYGTCMKCDGCLCEQCLDEHKEKYGTTEESYHEVNACDACSPTTLDERIQKLKRELVDLMFEQLKDEIRTEKSGGGDQ